MKKSIVLQDKFIQSGKSPVLDESNQTIGYIHYHFFNLRGRITIKDANEQLLSSGVAKIFTFLPEWKIYNSEGILIGKIKQRFSFLKKKYYYINNKQETYDIKGNIWDRKFEVTNCNGRVVLKITTLSSIISLKPHTFAIEFVDISFDTWEAVQVVQGVRSLVKRAKEAANNAHHH